MPSHSKRRKSRKSKDSRSRKSRSRKSRSHKSRSHKLLSPRKMWDVALHFGLDPRTNSQKDILAALKRAKIPVKYYTRK